VVQTQLENIEVALVAFIQAVTGQNVVNERNPGPRPDSPFISMMMATEEGTDWPYHDFVDPPLTLSETVTDPTYLTLQLAAYGKGCQAALNQVRLMIRSTGFTAPVMFPGPVVTGEELHTPPLNIQVITGGTLTISQVGQADINLTGLTVDNNGHNISTTVATLNVAQGGTTWSANNYSLVYTSASSGAILFSGSAAAILGFPITYANPIFDLMALVGLGGCGPVNNTTTEFNGRRLEQAAMSISFYALLSQDMQPADFFTSTTLQVDINVASPVVPAPEPPAGTHKVTEVTSETITATDAEFAITIGNVPD
jgi:hypothetical protein